MRKKEEFNYFDEFSSYEEYSKTSVEKHFEDCNNAIISRIAYDIERIEMFINENEKALFIF